MAHVIGAGLAENPFSAARFAPGRLSWIGPEGHIARLCERASAAGARHQVLGAHGTGKSTLLVHLENRARLVGISCVRFRGSRGVPVLALSRLSAERGRPKLILVDEVAELGRASFAAIGLLARLSGAGLVVTTHRDLGFATLARCAVDGATAERLIAQLVARGGRAISGPIAFVPPSLADLDDRLTRHAGNLRDVLFELYDEAERRAFQPCV